MASLEIPILIHRTLAYWAEKDQKLPSELADTALADYLSSYQDKYEQVKEKMAKNPEMSFDEARRQVNFWNDPEYDESEYDKPWDTEPGTGLLEYSEEIDSQLTALSKALKNQSKLTFVTEGLDEYLECRYFYERLVERYGEDMNFDLDETVSWEEVKRQSGLSED